jgi:hypothetical protein
MLFIRKGKKNNHFNMFSGLDPCFRLIPAPWSLHWHLGGNTMPVWCTFLFYFRLWFAFSERIWRSCKKRFICSISGLFPTAIFCS